MISQGKKETDHNHSNFRCEWILFLQTKHMEITPQSSSRVLMDELKKRHDIWRHAQNAG